MVVEGVGAAARDFFSGADAETDGVCRPAIVQCSLTVQTGVGWGLGTWGALVLYFNYM